MVKKLFKYEFAAYLKTLIPFNIVLLSVALFTRLVQFFETDIAELKFIYEIMLSLSVMTYVATIIACFAAVFVMAVIRFYRNLYTAEGYLSFTLPVTASQHIFVKLTTAVALMGLTLVTTVVSLAIATAGELGVEILKAAGYLAQKFVEAVGANGCFYVVEIIVLLVVSLCVSLLFYYTCISLGQLFKKNRVLGAVGVYFIFYFASQILSAIFMVIWNIAIMTIDYQKLMEFAEDNVSWLLHLLFIGSAVLYAAVGTAYFFVNKFIMSKKLNLE